jgi:hypothetical protein
MSIHRFSSVLTAALIVSTVSANAQQSPARTKILSTQIQPILRAFYFNLAHQNWEALTADILPAKVVAHRPAPEALVMSGTTPDDPVACSSTAPALVEQATIRLDGDWAEVSVPHCTVSGTSDEFRLIHFEGRWRFVFIQLFQVPVNVSSDW